MRRNIVFACVALVLIFAFVFSGLRILESAGFFYQDEETPVKSKTITKDGVDYFPRQDITVLMLLGIGKWGEVEPEEPNQATAADMITLLIFDETAKKVDLLSLNRDTMVTMPQLDKTGKKSGAIEQQLCLSHVYGTGLEDSCENTRTAVSDFLWGIRIDHYVSITLDVISIMTDAVGGVTVNVTDDFSNLDPAIQMGVHTLRGQQAVTFVQARRALEDPLNLSRMNRHEEYLNKFLPAMRAKNEESDTFALRTYEKIAPYIVSDCSVNVLTGMMQRYTDYSIGEHVTPEGTNVLGESYYEFYADEENLEDLILRLFYREKA